MQEKDEYILNLLEDAGLLTRSQIDSARARLNGSGNAVELLIKEGAVSETDVSRSLAAQAHMDWVDLSAKVIPPDVINQIRAEDARRFKVIPVGFGESGSRAARRTIRSVSRAGQNWSRQSSPRTLQRA